MSECARFRPLIEDLLAEQLDPADQAVVDHHLASCAQCRALVALHEQLEELALPVAMPAAGEFRQMRSALLAAVGNAASQPVAPAPRATASRWWAIGTSLATAATLLLGIFVGRMTVPEATLDERQLLASVMAQANASDELSDLWTRPYSYANVSTGEVRNGQVHFDFDVCSRLDVTAPVTAPLARELLSHAVLDSPSVAERLRAIEISATNGDSRLREALALSLAHDPSVAVRIEALNALAVLPGAESGQAALLQALRADPSVQIRLMALEQLVAQQADIEQLRQVIRSGQQESDPALLQRVQQLRDDERAAGWL